MRVSNHLLVAGALIGLGLVPRPGAAQGASTGRDLFFTDDPARATCAVVMVEPQAKGTQAPCNVVECEASGERCACPVVLPNGWKQPLTAEQCRQLSEALRPLPPVDVAGAAAKEKPKATSPATQVEKGKDKDRNLYTVRLQAQGDGVEESVVLAGSTPITVAAGLNGLEALKGKLSRQELLVRADSFRRAERFIRSGPPGGITPGRRSFYASEGGPVRVDIEIIRGFNFRE